MTKFDKEVSDKDIKKILEIYKEINVPENTNRYISDQTWKEIGDIISLNFQAIEYYSLDRKLGPEAYRTTIAIPKRILREEKEEKIKRYLTYFIRGRASLDEGLNVLNDKKIKFEEELGRLKDPKWIKEQIEDYNAKLKDIANEIKMIKEECPPDEELETMKEHFFIKETNYDYETVPCKKL